MYERKFSENLPENIKIVPTTFVALRERIQRLYSFTINLEKPYKLCDYKPAYGEIFQEELKNYEWFGWCDIDLIWGNLYDFLGKYLEDTNNDKLLEHGHCTLLRNNAKMRTLYRESAEGILNYKEVFSTSKSCFFDEHGPNFEDNAFGKLCKIKGVTIQTRMIPILDCSVFTPWFTTFAERTEENLYRNTLIVYENGAVYWAYRLRGDAKVYIQEVMYAHIQKRKICIEAFPTNRFCIVPPGKIIDYVPEWRNHVCKIASNNLRMRYLGSRIFLKIMLRRWFMQVLCIKNNIIGRK